MVSVTVNGIKCKICSTWEDVDFEKIVGCSNTREELAALSDIPVDIINRATDQQLFPLFTVISFIHESELLPFIHAEDIQVKAYKLYGNCVKILALDEKPYSKILRCARQYYPNEKNSVHLVGYGLSIIEQIAAFREKYEDMFNDEPEKNAVAAGIEELNGFGHWATAFNLCGRDLFKVDDVLEMPLIKIQTALYYNWKESKYQRRKFELDHPVKK